MSVHALLFFCYNIFMISKRVLKIKDSAPLSINNRVLELKNSGRRIISFGIGEPNFDVPEEIKTAVIRAVEENYSRYTASDGSAELKRAIIKKFSRDNGIEYGEKNIIASTGGKQCVFQAFQALLNSGDEVILPSPYWCGYTEDIKLAGGIIVPVETAPSFRLRAEDVARAVTPKTKIIVLNSPSNPTGMMIAEGELQKIAELAVSKNIYVLSDEVYEYFYYGARPISIASLGEGIKNLTITINSVSKSFGMTGWRLGYAAGPEDVIAGMKKVQDQVTSNPCGLSQKGAITAMEMNPGWITSHLSEFKKKKDFVVGALREMNISVEEPDGAFYVFFDVSKYFGDKIAGSIRSPQGSSTDFCKELLEDAGVAIMPGVAFGNDNCVRVSYACSWEDLREGMGKFSDFLSKIR